MEYVGLRVPALTSAGLGRCCALVISGGCEGNLGRSRGGVTLSADGRRAGRNLKWNADKTESVRPILIAARAYGHGKRGPQRPGITVPRRSVEEEEDNEDSQFGFESRGGGEAAGADPLVLIDNDDESPRSVNEDAEPSRDDEMYHFQNSLVAARSSSEASRRRVSNSYSTRTGVFEDSRAMETELEELYEEVGRMIDEGLEDNAREVISANYEALMEQLEEGIGGVEQAAMLDILAQLLMDMGDYDSAQVLLDQIKEILDGIRCPHPSLDSVLEHVGSMYAGMDKPEEALPFYLRCLSIQEGMFGKGSHLLAKSILGLAKAYRDIGNGSKSVELYQRALVISERSPLVRVEILILILTHLGHTLLEEERNAEAESTLQRAIVLTQDAYGARDGRVGVATCALARAKCGQGKIDDAVCLYRQGLQLMEDCPRFSPHDPVIETVRTDLAEMLNYLDRNTEAQDLWEKNLRVKEAELGKNDVMLVPHLNNLATSYAHAQLFDKCEPVLRRSLKLLTNHFGPRAPQVSVSLELLATALHQLGRGVEAEPLAREAVSIREALYGLDHPSTAQACNCLAAVLHGLGRDVESELYLRRVLKVQEKELGPDCPEILMTLELLVMLLEKQGRQREIPPIVRRLQSLEAMLSDGTDFDEEQENDG